MKLLKVNRYQVKKILSIQLLIILTFISFDTSPESLVREFSGSHSITTPEFEVKAPWILDWRINSNYRENMGLEISLVDAKTGFMIGRIFKTNYAGNGVKLFNESGRYRLRISSSFTNWNFKVSQISPSEAELYSPKIR
tara:strand:+ start:1039 stop:1455 length:417 start_codon:yes stop_codon:yes gene_type:complete